MLLNAKMTSCKYEKRKSNGDKIVKVLRVVERVQCRTDFNFKFYENCSHPHKNRKTFVIKLNSFFGGVELKHPVSMEYQREVIWLVYWLIANNKWLTSQQKRRRRKEEDEKLEEWISSERRDKEKKYIDW